MSSLTPLSAETEIALKSPRLVMSKLREHLGEHGAVSGADDSWRVTFDIGTAFARLRGDAVRFRVEAADDTSLAYLQWGLAEHVCEFAPDETPVIVWQGGARAGQPLPYFREMRVVRTSQVTPRLRRLTLAGADLGRFAHDGIHVRLLLPRRKGVKPVWPVMAADGRQAWPEGERPIARVYTIRRIDVAAGEIDIDFVLHEGEETPGASFALEARPSDVVGMTGPGGGELKPADWYLLAGDETALPAIARMLEEMPAGKKAVALIEVADDAEIQSLPTRADVDLRWFSRAGRAAGTTTLLQDAVAELAFPASDTEIFVWAGCEHTAFRAIRKHLRTERGLSRRTHLVAAYWRRGVAGEIDAE